MLYIQLALKVVVPSVVVSKEGMSFDLRLRPRGNSTERAADDDYGFIQKKEDFLAGRQMPEKNECGENLKEKKGIPKFPFLEDN